MPKTETAETGRGAEALIAGAYTDRDIELLVEEGRIPFVLGGWFRSGKGKMVVIPPVGATVEDAIVRRDGGSVFVAPDGTAREPATLVKMSKEEADKLANTVRRVRFAISQRPLGIGKKTA